MRNKAKFGIVSGEVEGCVIQFTNSTSGFTDERGVFNDNFTDTDERKDLAPFDGSSFK